LEQLLEEGRVVHDVWFVCCKKAPTKMTDAVTRDELAKLRVVDLKKLLHARVLSVTGLKADLIDRILEHDSKNVDDADEKNGETTNEIEEKTENSTEDIKLEESIKAEDQNNFNNEAVNTKKRTLEGMLR
jgi:predicted GIY-YIG superfamily endonuclease